MRTFDVRFKKKVVREYLSGKGGYKILASPLEAHVLRERWRRLYNERRPHSRLGCRPPITAYLTAQQ